MIDIKRFATDPMEFFDSLIIPSAKGNRPFRDVMAPHQRQWFRAIAPSMMAVAKGEKPPIGRFWTERTKGASKDSDTACVLLWLLAFSRNKLDMQVGAADRDQAQELKKAAADVLRLNDWLAARVQSQAFSLICKATGSECAIVAADVAGSHGARPDIVVMNELSHVTKEEFAANLLDNATKKPNGLVIVATNAGFTGTWQYVWREMARESERWHFDQFAEPAPWLSDAEVEEAQRRNSKSRFHRLFWGAWVSQSGDALDDEDIAACIDPDLLPRAKRSGLFYVAGLDLGIKHDHSALVVVGGDRSTQQLELAYAESWAPDAKTGKVDLVAVERTVLETHNRFDLTTLGFDPYQAELMAQRLDLQRVPVKEVPFIGANLNEMASTMLDVFRSHRIRLFDHKKLIRDLGRLSIVEKSYGYRLEAVRDVDGHADLATALAIVLPIAVAELGSVPVIAGAIDDNWDDLTPFERAMRDFEARKRSYEAEMNRLSKPDDPNEPFRRLMQDVGRAKRDKTFNDFFLF